MNRLEELAGSLTAAARWVESGVASPHDAKRMREAAAILLAASKVDVAGLMELVAKVSNAAYVAGLQDANGEGCDATAQTLFEDELETALRMALAQRGWVGLTDDENIEVLDAVDWYNFPEDLIAETSRRLKEKNA